MTNPLHILLSSEVPPYTEPGSIDAEMRELPRYSEMCTPPPSFTEFRIDDIPPSEEEFIAATPGATSPNTAPPPVANEAPATNEAPADEAPANEVPAANVDAAIPNHHEEVVHKPKPWWKTCSIVIVCVFGLFLFAGSIVVPILISTPENKDN